jgi:hypothetical protein
VEKHSLNARTSSTGLSATSSALVASRQPQVSGCRPAHAPACRAASLWLAICSATDARTRDCSGNNRMQPVPRPLAGRLDQPLNVGFKLLAKPFQVVRPLLAAAVTGSAMVERPRPVFIRRADPTGQFRHDQAGSLSTRLKVAGQSRLVQGHPAAAPQVGITSGVCTQTRSRSSQLIPSLAPCRTPRRRGSLMLV